MEAATPLEVFRSGLEVAYYLAFIVMAVTAFTLISSELNKLILWYRDTINKLGADDLSLPPRIIAYLGLAFFTGGFVLAKPFFVGVGLLSMPLVIVNLRQLNRIDLWEQAARRKMPRRPE